MHGEFEIATETRLDRETARRNEELKDGPPEIETCHRLRLPSWTQRRVWIWHLCEPS